MKSQRITLGDKGEEVSMDNVLGDRDTVDDVDIVAATSEVDGFAGGVGGRAELGEVAEATVDIGDVLFDETRGASQGHSFDSSDGRQELLDARLFRNVGDVGFGEGSEFRGHGPVMKSCDTHDQKVE